MSWETDDVHLGNYAEIGESLRGMQDTQVGYGGGGYGGGGYGGGGYGAAALGQLRGALRQIAGNRFGAHAPTSKQMRSPYKDSTQIGIVCTGTFNLTSWSGSSLPVISGLTRVYKSFKPTKAILTELVTTTFSTATLGATTTSTMVVSASDLVLTTAFAGADNCFPNAPTEATGIAGPSFANNSLGNGISWPTVNGGIDMTVAFAVEQSVLFAVTPPSGYSSANITSVVVKARFNLLGPSLR